MQAKLVSVEGWREPEGGWTWNNQHLLRELTATEAEPLLDSPRRLFDFLRRENYAGPGSTGRLRVSRQEGDPTYIEIQDRRTGEPLWCLIVEWSEET